MKPEISPSSSILSLLSAVLLLAALSTPAAVINWTNTAGGWWSLDSNWSPNQVPTTNDIAVITNSGTYTVSLNLAPTLAGLVLGGESGTQTLSTAEQVLQLNGNGSLGPHGVFKLALGALSGDARLAVSGALVWDGGTIDTNAVVTIAAGGRMFIGPGANYGRVLHGAVTNAGTIAWAYSGWLFVGGVLHNLGSGLFDAQWSAPIVRYGASPLIINDGVFRKSLDGGGIDCSVPLVNNSTVDVQGGTLLLGDGSVLNSGCQFIGAGVTRMDAGTNLLNGSVLSSNLILNGATLVGAGSFNGILKWNAGTIGYDAAVLITSNSWLDISSGAEMGKALVGNLTNAGTITYRPYGPLGIMGVLHNTSSGLFDLQDPNRDLAKWGLPALIVNDGIFRKSGQGLGVACAVPIINNGTVDTQAGRLGLADGSVFNSGCQFIGQGMTICGAGTNTLNGTVYSENLVLDGVTLQGAGALSGKVQWASGIIDSGATVLVATNGWLDISSGAEMGKALLGSLTNAGTITYKPTGPLGLAGVLHNAPGGLFEIQDPNRDLANWSSAATFINQGIFRKTGSGGRTCSVPFTNHGTVEIVGGVLGFDGGYANPAGTISLQGGTFQLPQPLELAGGLLTGWGTVQADVVNAATLRPTRSGGPLTIQGNYSQGLGGKMEFELAGNSPGVDHGRLNITGTTHLRGTIGVLWADAYLPEPGTNFAVLTFASRQGQFCCFDNFILLGHGRQLTPVYSATGVTLATVPAAEPTAVPLRVTVDGAALVCWPVEFPGYTLYWATNLSQANWALLPGVANRFLESPPLANEKFFRLQKP